MSNYYATLVKRFGIDLPVFYPLSWREQRTREMATILTDLKRSLPQAMKRVTLDDLMDVEREPFGAETIARAQFGADFARLVQVSSFQAE